MMSGRFSGRQAGGKPGPDKTNLARSQIKWAHQWKALAGGHHLDWKSRAIGDFKLWSRHLSTV